MHLETTFIFKSSFLVKIVRCTKPSSVCFLCKDSTRTLNIRLQKHNGNEQQRKRPGLNMTETWLDISVPETWRKLDRIAKPWYYTFPQNVNVTETWSSMFLSRLRNAETWDFVLCLSGVHTNFRTFENVFVTLGIKGSLEDYFTGIHIQIQGKWKKHVPHQT